MSQITYCFYFYSFSDFCPFYAFSSLSIFSGCYLFYFYYFMYCYCYYCFSFYLFISLAPSPSSSLSFSGMYTNSFSEFECFFGGGPGGGGGFIFILSALEKFSSSKYFPFLPHLRSLTSIGSPNYKSSVQT